MTGHQIFSTLQHSLDGRLQEAYVGLEFSLQKHAFDPQSITVEKSKSIAPLSTNDLVRMKKKLGLSGVKTKQLAGMIRVGLKDRKAVKSGLAEALVESNRVLDVLFTAEQVKVLTKTGEEEEKTLIYCKDVMELVLYLLEHRELEEISADYKLGLDGGQGSIKLILKSVIIMLFLEFGSIRSWTIASFCF